MTEHTGGLASLVRALGPGLASAYDGRDVSVTARGVALVLAHDALANGPLVVVTDTTSGAERLRAELAALTDAEVALWPAWDINPLERVSPDFATMGARSDLRVRVADGEGPLVIVTSARGVTQVVPREAPASRVLAPGDTVDRDELVSWLVRHGARREALVEHRGEVAVRGDIVDLWSPQHDEPLRVEFFGDEVERLGFFDVGTQRTTSTPSRARLTAVREWLPTDDERARASERLHGTGAAREVAQRLADGEVFDGLEAWLPVLGATTTVSALFARHYRFAVVDDELARRRSLALHDEESALVSVLMGTWGLTGTPPLLHVPFDDALAPEDVSLVVRAMAPSAPPLEIPAPPDVAGNLALLATHVREASTRGPAVVSVATPEAAQHVADELERAGLLVNRAAGDVAEAAVSVVSSPLSDGFVSRNPPATVWGEHDVYARRVAHRKPRARSRASDGFFDDLAIGSYVTHDQHGLGKFVGSTTRALNGTVRDYLILEFRGGDRLFVPTERINLLTPYTGGEEPSLSKMGGAEWRKTKAKAKAAAVAIAEELVVLYRARAQAEGFAFSPDTPWQREVESLFAYTETPDQARAIAEVKADMEAPRPMDRLVCADVGFGKTEIALRAVFKAVQDGKQAVVLAPTTLLASQHVALLSERFAGYPVTVKLLSRFVEPADATATLRGLADGSVDVVVGTHRLLSDSVVFKNLGLLVVDEEQRFGVSHKDAIKRLSAGVDVLTLSASPIPRTLEMALTGIRDLSLVQTPPFDRRPILTHVGEYDEGAVIEAIRRELLREGQVFYVHNRVHDIDEVAQKLAALVPDARVAVAHGQMDEGTLETIVNEFYEKRFDVLVCTTIVESGIDMPNVNTLIVDRADRLGLGQLHQLRGRVGRGGARAYAYLFYPRDRELTETALERLRTIGEHTELGSGFKIAMRDLAIRGAGSLLGHSQSGHEIAAVGYDHYMRLVAESVREARGEQITLPASVTLDVPGEAFLPVDYVESDGERLEAYRRLGAVTGAAELDDIAAEWRDRYGSLPAAASALLELVRLRIRCNDLGITDVVVQPPDPGRRPEALARLSPLTLPLSKQMYLKRVYGPMAYRDEGREIRVALTSGADVVPTLLGLLDELVPSTSTTATH